MTNYILTIGLNARGATIETEYAYAATLQRVAAIYGAHLHDARTIKGEWGGIPERSVQFRLISVPLALAAPALLAGLAAGLHQESVAIIADGAEEWVLVFADGKTTAGGTVAEYPREV